MIPFFLSVLFGLEPHMLYSGILGTFSRIHYFDGKETECEFTMTLN